MRDEQPPRSLRSLPPVGAVSALRAAGRALMSAHHDRKDGLAVQRDRLRIAQAAARLIAEHGLADWTLAKRKAVRQLLLPETAPLPSNEEIEGALADYHALFGGDAHLNALRRQRIEALAWMRRLAPWDPVLAGGVAAGWATEHSDIRLELVADDPKAGRDRSRRERSHLRRTPPARGRCDRAPAYRIVARRDPACDRHPAATAQPAAEERRIPPDDRGARRADCATSGSRGLSLTLRTSARRRARSR